MWIFAARRGNKILSRKKSLSEKFDLSLRRGMTTSTQGVVGLWVRDVSQRRISCLEASYKQRANNFCHFMHVCVSAWLTQLRLTMDKYTLSHTSLLYLKMFHMFTLFKMNAFTSVILKKLNFDKIILKKDLTNMGILFCVFVLGFP